MSPFLQRRPIAGWPWPYYEAFGVPHGEPIPGSALIPPDEICDLLNVKTWLFAITCTTPDCEIEEEFSVHTGTLYDESTDTTFNDPGWLTERDIIEHNLPSDGAPTGIIGGFCGLYLSRVTATILRTTVEISLRYPAPEPGSDPAAWIVPVIADARAIDTSLSSGIENRLSQAAELTYRGEVIDIAAGGFAPEEWLITIEPETYY